MARAEADDVEDFVEEALEAVQNALESSGLDGEDKGLGVRLLAKRLPGLLRGLASEDDTYEGGDDDVDDDDS